MRRMTKLVGLWGWWVAAGCLPPAGVPQAVARVPIIGLPCEGCEAVFEGLPANPGSVSRIAPPGEPGEALRIEGTVYDAAGRPARGVIVYAYHTDARGIYPPDERFRGKAAYRHGRLRGWATTDSLGRYRFETIRPGPYPGRDDAAHVHMHVIEPGCCTYYIASIRFTDDPLLTPESRAESVEGRGGSGLVKPEPGPGGVTVVRRDIYLGRGVPDYPPPRRTPRRSSPAVRRPPLVARLTASSASPAPGTTDRHSARRSASARRSRRGRGRSSPFPCRTRRGPCASG